MPIILLLLFFSMLTQAEYRSVTRDNGNMFFSLERIHLFIFHEKDHRLLVIDGGADIKKAFEQHNCVAGINGGYFGADKARTPLGMIRHQGRTLHGRVLSGTFTVSGILYDTGKGVMLQRSKKLSTPIAQMREAIQAGPFLLEKGKVVAGLNNKGHSPRSFIATDGKGLWCIGQSSPMTLEALAQWLQSEDFQKHFPARLALNLDGGSSSGFYSAKAKKFISPLRPIRYCIGIAPR